MQNAEWRKATLSFAYSAFSILNSAFLIPHS